MNSATSPSPRNVRSRRPSMKTGATGSSNVPGRLIPMSACFDSPGPLTTQPMTATRSVLGARVRLAPDRHLVLEVALDLLGHLLEERRGRPAAAGAGRHLGQERAQPERLEDLLGDLDLALARRAGLGRERDPDRVADPLVEQDRQPRRRGDDPLVAHPGLGQPEVERVVAARRQQPVDVDEVAHARHLRRQDDPVVAHPGRLGQLGRAHRRLEHRLDHHVARVARRRGAARWRPSARSGWPGRASPS